ncbi:MAG: cytochrome P450 [Sandaracinaceae bacterium]|nr:cytochrome P450 [Sandaracinaceae bacterium]
MTSPTLESPRPRAEAARRPPGPPPRAAGALGRLRYGLNFLLDPFGFVGGRFQRYGDVYFVDAEGGAQPGLYVLRHPAHFEEVLVDKARSFDKGHSAFELLSELLGHGLLTTDDEVWRRQRRLVQPAFSKQRLEGYAAQMVAEADAEARRVRAGEPLDVSRAMMEMTLRIVCRTLFGYDSSGDAEPVRRSLAALQSSLTGVALALPLPSFLSPQARRMKRARAELDRIIYGLIDARRPREPHDDLLQRLVDAVDEDGSTLTREEVRDQLVTLFLAGHETTSNALTWTLHLLAEHPEEEARLFAELDEVLGGRLPTAADLPRLVYTDRVFTEAMRLYPPVYVVSRRAREDVQIGGWSIPRGSELALWIWHAHRDPRFWDEPWAFRPDRFAPGADAGRPRLAYAPFGAGARACIGKVFAQMEGVLSLATLSSRWRLRSTGAHVELSPRVTLSPRGGLRLVPERRGGPANE